MINRNMEKSERACEALHAEFGVPCEYLLADFADLSQVREAADTLVQRHERIDLLVNNVGMHSTTLTRTANGLETVFCVNHLASFALTWLLMDTMRRSAPSRIIQVNSQGHRFGGLRLDDLAWQKRHYTGLRGYGAAKTAQLLTVWHFAQLLQGSGVTINAMHPGAVKSSIGNNNGPLYRWFKNTVMSRTLGDPVVSGQAIHYLATAPELEQTSGQYFNLTHPEKPAPHALDGEAGRRVWEESLRLTGLA
jgi:NAD(P)-dependent dehydrogenase (short-subunit alcohol dehydrogenase family)